jgi:hypothetical protein
MTFHDATVSLPRGTSKRGKEQPFVDAMAVSVI